MNCTELDLATLKFNFSTIPSIFGLVCVTAYMIRTLWHCIAKCYLGFLLTVTKILELDKTVLELKCMFY